MSSTQLLGIVGALVTVVVLFEMLRRHRLREKYAVTWFLLATGAIVVGLVPQILIATADVLGLEVPANLLFFVATFVLLGLTLQHSFELVRAEERTRTLAEEVALLRLQVEALQQQPPVAGAGTTGDAGEHDGD